MTEQYASPSAPGDSIDWKQINGSLLLIQPLAIETNIPTVHGPATAVRASVTVVDGPRAGEVHEDALIFPRVLQGQVRSKIGAKVLGRLGQGVAKPGQTAPWMLQEATPQDIETANRMSPQGAQNRPQQAPAAQGSPWGQQPQQASAQPPF